MAKFALKDTVLLGPIGQDIQGSRRPVESDALVTVILSAAVFAQSMSSPGWVTISDVSPPGMMGLVGGLFSAAANLSGIVTPLAIGIIVKLTGSFVGALAFVGIVAPIGALAWIFVIGDLHRMTVERETVAG